MYVTLQGMIKYWEMRGKEEDVWISCDSPEERLTVYFKIGDIIFSPSLFRWFESNCTMQPGVGKTKINVNQISNSIFRDGHMGTL